LDDSARILPHSLSPARVREFSVTFPPARQFSVKLDDRWSAQLYHDREKKCEIIDNKHLVVPFAAGG